MSTLPAERDVSGAFVGDAVLADLESFARRSPAHTRLKSVRGLADDYGVSHSTAKRVLDRLADEGLVYAVHGRGFFVAEQDEADTVVYVDSIAKSNHIFWTRRLEGISKQLEKEGLRLQLRRHDGLLLDCKGFLEDLAKPGVCGAILPWIDEDIYDELKGLNSSLKMVAFGHSICKPDVSSVWIDEIAAANAAVSHLCRLGIRRITTVSRSRVFLAAAEGTAELPWNQADCLSVYVKSADLPDLASIDGQSAEGLIFSDDRDAAAFVAEHGSDRSIIAVANAGEDHLPPNVHKLDMDGQELGIAAARLLGQMLNDPTLPSMSVRIAPRLRQQ